MWPCDSRDCWHVRAHLGVAAGKIFCNDLPRDKTFQLIPEKHPFLPELYQIPSGVIPTWARGRRRVGLEIWGLPVFLQGHPLIYPLSCLLSRAGPLISC